MSNDEVLGFPPSSRIPVPPSTIGRWDQGGGGDDIAGAS